MDKIIQDYILLILNCEKYRFKAEKQKSLWIPFLPSALMYFHVIGNPDLPTAYSLDRSNSILYVQSEDDYIHLPKKVIRAYEAIHELFDYAYIFKTDDDQQLQTSKFFPTLMSILSSYQNKKHIDYGGLMVHLQTDQVSQYYKFHPELPTNILLKKGGYCNGRFYILSYKAIDALLILKSDIEKEYFEDYAIGHYLPESIKQNFLPLQTGNYFKDF